MPPELDPETDKIRPKRLWIRRWARPCRSCGTPIVFLENTRPPVPGKKWSKWALVELYGERDGVLMPWNGEIAYDPRFHVLHLECPEVRKRKAWLIRRATEDL